jgi:hypothetical protein
MTVIKAKPIIKDQFWILKRGDRKVGEINLRNEIFDVKIDNQQTSIHTISNLREKFGIEIDTSVNPEVGEKILNSVHGYPADGEVNEPMWDLQNNLPLYTKQDNSKSLYSAGWYNVNIKGKNKLMFCPKLIILQRNHYDGPFKEKPAPNEFENFFE